MKHSGIAQRMGIAAVACGMAFGQSTAPIPDPVALVKELEAHQLRMDEIRENFACREITQTDEVEKSGKVKSTSSEEQELFFVNGYRIRRLVKKNGVALSRGAEKDEQNRIRKLVEKRSKEPRGRGGFRRDSGVSISISSLLEVMRITNPRRVLLNGGYGRWQGCLGEFVSVVVLERLAICGYEGLHACGHEQDLIIAG